MQWILRLQVSAWIIKCQRQNPLLGLRDQLAHAEVYLIAAVRVRGLQADVIHERAAQYSLIHELQAATMIRLIAA